MNYETKITELTGKIEEKERLLQNAIQNANMQIAQMQGEINGMKSARDFLLEQTETESNESENTVEPESNPVAEG